MLRTARTLRPPRTPNPALPFAALLALATVATLAALAAPTPAAAAPSSTYVPLGQARIVGGNPADAGQHRWITSIQNGGHFCGATLIAPRWVATAAHCLEGESPGGVTVWVGGHDLGRPQEGERVGVEAFHVHPDYDPATLAADIALLELAGPVAGIEPALLATPALTKKLAKPGKIVTVSGWGDLAESGPAPDVLHEVRLPVVGNAACNAPQAYAGDIAKSQLCAGLAEGGRDSCQGDSGGPLWSTQAGGRDVLLGIVSWGDGCAQPQKYGVYTRVASFKKWVDATLADAGAGGPPGDSAPDFAPAPAASCQNACGTNAGPCWCDPECVANGDCCADYAAICTASDAPACEAETCAVDPYCCAVEWDALCQETAEALCAP